MADTVTIDGREWNLEGVPAHMVAHLPHEVDVTVRQPLPLPPMDAPSWMWSAHSQAEDLNVRTHRIQLECDGKKLTRGDAAPSWTAGEREGWRPWVATYVTDGSDEIHDCEED